MDKRLLHHLLTNVRRVKIWYLAVLLVISGTVCVFALRDNNLRMVQLRDNVYKADQNNDDVEGALKKLQAFVYSHMNTELATSDGVYPPIQLKYTYERLQAAEKARAHAGSDQTYNEAQQYCEQQNPNGFSGRGRVQCIENYVKTHGTTDTAEKKIPDAMYKFNFTSPTWSPDLAGFSLLISILLLIALVLRVSAGYILKLLTR